MKDTLPFSIKFVVGVTLLFLIIPIIVIVVMSFNAGTYLEFPPSGFSLRWYHAFFSDPDWVQSLLTSLQIALGTTILALLLGVPASFVLVRRSISFKPLWVGLFTLPTVFPVIVSAVSLYFIFSHLHVVDTKLGLILSHTILALPVVILPLMAALQRFDRRLEWQAQSLGASSLKVFTSVTFPLLSPTFITVSLFAFITSFDEIVFALFLSGGSTVTLPKKIWENLRFEIQPTVAAISTLTILVATGTLLFFLIASQRSSIMKREDISN